MQRNENRIAAGWPILLAIACLLTLPACTVAQVSETYTNPFSDLKMGDPFVVRYDDTYYLTGTTDSGRGFRMWSSKNLRDWEPRGMVYQKTEGTWGHGSFWAPELFTYGGKYYLTYSASRKENEAGEPGFRVCLAVADRPTGPYRDIAAPWCDPGYPCIDAHVFVDDDGTPYLYFAKVGVIREPKFKLYGIIYGVKLKRDLSGADGEPVMCTRAEQDWETPDEGRSLCNEGAFVLKHGGRYYMTYSANHYAEAFYGIGVATAPSPLGPWTKEPTNPLLGQDLDIPIAGPGHSSITTSPDGREMFIVYHAHIDPTGKQGGRNVNIDRLVIEDGRMKVIGPTRTPQPLPSGAEPSNGD